jgi:hypothetical protein
VRHLLLLQWLCSYSQHKSTSKDGRRLQQLKQQMIPLKETALGFAAKQNAKAVAAHLDKLNDSDKKELLEALEADRKTHRGQPNDDDNYGAI